MKRKGIILIVCSFVVVTIAVILVTVTSGLLSAELPNTPWKLVSKDAYKLVKTGSGDPVLYRILQDREKTMIVSMTSEKGEMGGSLKENWKEIRNELMSSFKSIKKIDMDDNLQSAQEEEFDVPYSDSEGDKVEKFFMVNAGSGKSVIIPMEAEGFTSNYYIGLGCEFVSSNDKTKYLIASDKGLWMLEGNSKNAVMISKKTFNGKSYEELQAEISLKYADSDGTEGLFWNDSPIFSPDGSKIVYITNRDCISTGGQSVWLYDLGTGEEKVLTNSSGEYYRCIGWLSPNHILCQKYSGEKVYNIVIEDTGKIIDLSLEGKNVEILGTTYSGLIAYAPYYSSNEIFIDKFDTASSAPSRKYQNKINGTLRSGHSFSDDEAKFAYLFAPGDNDTVQYIGIININEASEMLISELPANKEQRIFINSFSWINSEKLLVNLSTVKEGLEEISTWTYSLKGGQ